MTLENINHLTLLKVTGADTTSFLQGQLSNDIEKLDNGWQFSAYCNPKGRALAVFIVWSHDDAIYMLLDSSVVEPVIKRLKMYVLRSKVVFEAIDANLLAAFEAEQLTEQYSEVDFGLARYAISTTDNAHILHFGDRCLIVDYSASAAHHSGTDWLQADIKDALPRVTAQSSEMFIPQMLNMDLLNGVSFKKGCYTGQEIIARMRYLGKLKQRLFVCQLDDALTTEANISIGEKIIDNDGKTVGNIANAAAQSAYFSAALRFDNLDNGLVLESGAKVRVITPQPYSHELE